MKIKGMNFNNNKVHQTTIKVYIPSHESWMYKDQPVVFFLICFTNDKIMSLSTNSTALFFNTAFLSYHHLLTQNIRMSKNSKKFVFLLLI